MELQHKPRLGILALMLEGYEPLFPGIMASQHKYVEEVIASLSGTADFVFPRIAASREAIEALTAQYNAEGLDGILILMLSYSQGQYLVHAMQRNTLPLALALVQPDETVGDDFEEWGPASPAHSSRAAAKTASLQPLQRISARRRTRHARCGG